MNMFFVVLRCRAHSSNCRPMPVDAGGLTGATLSFRRQRRLAGWQSWLRSVAGSDLAEYKDLGGGVHRAARSRETIRNMPFVARRGMRAMGCGQEPVAADALGDDQRRLLLSGKSIDGLASAARSSAPALASAAPRFSRPSRPVLDCLRDRRATESRHQLRLVHPELKRLIARRSAGAEVDPNSVSSSAWPTDQKSIRDGCQLG